MTGLVCEFGTPLRDHRQPAQQRSCPVLASLIHRPAARLDLPLLSEADAPPRHRSREWRGTNQACVRGVRRGGGANQRAVGVTLRNACPPPWRQLAAISRSSVGRRKKPPVLKG